MRRLRGGYSSLTPREKAELRAALSRQYVGSHPLAIFAIGSVAVVVWFVSSNGGKTAATLVLIGIGLYRIFVDGPRNFAEAYRTTCRITDQANEREQTSSSPVVPVDTTWRE